MLEELQELEGRFTLLESKLSDPKVINGDPQYPEYLKEHGRIADLVGCLRQYRKSREELDEAVELSRDDSDEEMAELAKSEIPGLKECCQRDLEGLKDRMLSSEDDGNRNVIMEIRAGTGGDESAIFVGDLTRMYNYYCDSRGWKVETLDASPSERGGYKEITMAISGDEVYACLKYESGTHRVQRVPETESQGRIHTSAVTVAVLPEAEEVEIDLKQEDVRIDRYCSSGPGGQSVNTTYSAVRLTHIPTGLVVTCQDEKSQIKNLSKAMRVLRSRLYDLQKQEKDKERSNARRNQIGSGDRSERIRTYNFPQNRLTDHRIGLTLYDLGNIIKGEISSVVNALREEEKKQRFAGLGDV